MLRYNDTNSTWLLYAKTQALVKLAGEVGLDKSVPATAVHGHPVYFCHSEYAALPFWDVANDGARDRLLLQKLRYDSSLVTSCARRFACPSDQEFMPLQSAAIDYALARPNCVIGDEVGVGKTASAIGIANEMQAKRVVVVCPANVRIQWQREIKAWTTLRQVEAAITGKSADGVSETAQFVIVSYDLLRSPGIFRALMADKYDLLIADEIHYAKEVTAARSIQLFGDLKGDRVGLDSRASRVVGLTGTFLPNRPRECYMTARHLCWDAIDWLSQEGFEHRYNPSMQMATTKGKPYVLEKRGRLPELRARLRCNMLVRRTKSDPEVRRQLAVSLPQYELTYVEPNGAIKKALKAESMLKIDPDKLKDIYDPNNMGHIMTVRKEMGIAKAPRVAQHVKMLLDSGLDKVVVFFHHIEVGKYLADKLANGVRIWGGTTANQKHQILNRFINDPRDQVLVGQMQACGTGTDGLQKVCRWVVLAEPSWTWGENEQVIGRVGARRGQTREVWVQILVAPGSLDERILGGALRKLRVIHDTLDGGDD